ncbi:MAG: Endospore coat-associated protein YheD [Firmicutes bacterium]|nr:Endospore coat-associated protein YheD [Bacillota bacterium]
MPFAEASYFRQLIAAASSLAMQAFVFCPLDIDWRSRTIYGYAYQKSMGSWLARQFPFPDVVYDRLFPPRGRLANVLFAAAKRLRRQGNVRLFGRSGRGKWETYRALFKHADVQEHIPHTMILRHVDDLAFMIKKYGYVFVKPDMGSQGKGVVAIKGTANGFSCHGRDHQNMPFSVSVTSLSAVLALARTASQRKRLLVQQGLNLNHLRGRTFDIRAVVQKDHEGKWQVTGTAVRMGRPNSVTSNLHGGGSAVRTEGLLRNLFAEKSAQIMAVLSRLAVSIPELMDRELGRYGELGLDFGVDRDGKVWLIEANSKPGRTIFLHIKDPSLRQASILRPMQYCKYLALEKRSGGESLG